MEGLALSKLPTRSQILEKENGGLEVILRAILIVAADTGLRENEMFTLEKGDID
jgi:hypothetical protein